MALEHALRNKDRHNAYHLPFELRDGGLWQQPAEVVAMEQRRREPRGVHEAVPSGWCRRRRVNKASYDSSVLARHIGIIIVNVSWG